MKPVSRCRILVIEDDLRMVELLREGLSERGHAVATATTADEGERLIERQPFDAIVLDIGLPGRSGYTVVESLRTRARRPTIIMLTSLNQEDNVVYGLDAGADDYVTKPFSFPELAARIASAVRRNRIAWEDAISIGSLQLDLRKRALIAYGKSLFITRGEYLLLRALTLNRGEVVPRRQLIRAVWGITAVTSGALDTLLNTLREKMGPDACNISTIRGVGYRLEDESVMQTNAEEPLRSSAI
jgi:two-component system, OmpR family, response regulator